MNLVGWIPVLLLSPISAWSDGYEFAEKMSFVDFDNHRSFLQQIYKKIDTGIIYPDDLVQRRKRGKVSLHVKIDPQGAFAGEFSHVSGEDELLKTYVMAILIYLLKDPLPEGKHSDRFWWLILNFDFKLRYSGEIVRPLKNPVFRNSFTFNKRGWSKDEVSKAYEKLVSKFIPPILPIPGLGVYVDIPRAVTFFKDRGKADKDYMRDQRIKIRRDQWKLWIKKNTEKKKDLAPPPKPIN